MAGKFNRASELKWEKLALGDPDPVFDPGFLARPRIG